MIQSILGIFVLLGVGLLFSDNRRLISWRAVIGAFGIIIALAFFCAGNRDRCRCPAGRIEYRR